ncbi:LOW QUALITY PROTEIN: exocyst complex component 5-like [Haliotis rubra]|uniref:LOW QUALITY PROTEIN: exocyst complex component 5-like n=1 Tax=Haliotis rubra TaxID=36100 RepID=UPI001EE5D4CB|nr:LOW QUALITY PROTEIN: exocyst complex component 5-like [Haliotis rubra]
MSLEELDQEPFSVHEFVERLAWKTMGSRARHTSPEDFDPMLLHSTFEKVIRDLKEKNVMIARKIEKLENNCKDEEKRHWQRVSELQKKNHALYTHFQKLDERINYVATKVVHLGDQLEGVNTPRARAVEAQRLMNYLSEFLADEALKSPVLTDPFQLQLTADVIQKLHMIALELPGGKFDKARQRIADKYDSVEKELIGEFKLAHRDGDQRKMKRIASVLQNFKSYGICIDTFITESQKHSFLKENVFDDVLPLCQRTSQLINHVFTNPEMVMGKFVQSIFQGILQIHISKRLGDRSDQEQYLKNLNDLYVRTKELTTELSVFKLGNDSSFLNKLLKGIFQQHLTAYIDAETKYLHDRCSVLMLRYYEMRDHQKKQIQSGGIHDLRRDIQAKLGTVTKANINIGPAIENYGGETFLSQEVSINILQETKLAFKRCHVLSYDVPSHSVKIFEVLVQYLVTEHIDYAVELGLQAIPLPDPKTEPEIYFFDVINQANTLFHLFEKQFMDSLVPLVLSSPRHALCLKRKRELRETLENKIGTGLDRSLNTIIGWTKYILATEQKKSDFKPEEDCQLQMLSVACGKVVKFMKVQGQAIQSSLDGKNVEVVLVDLGKRFHRVIYEHIVQFQYNEMGAMLVICDINEYRKCVKEEFKIPMVTQLFEKLHALCNLLVVVPENIKVVRDDEQLAMMEESVVLQFVQLRADFKTASLANKLKELK